MSAQKAQGVLGFFPVVWKCMQIGAQVSSLCGKYTSLSYAHLCEKETKEIRGYVELEVEVMDHGQIFPANPMEMTLLHQKVQLLIPDRREDDPG